MQLLRLAPCLVEALSGEGAGWRSFLTPDNEAGNRCRNEYDPTEKELGKMEQMSVRPGRTFFFLLVAAGGGAATHTTHHLFRRRNNSLVTAATYAFRAPLIKHGFVPRASKAGGICCQKHAEPGSQKCGAALSTRRIVSERRPAPRSRRLPETITAATRGPISS